MPEPVTPTAPAPFLLFMHIPKNAGTTFRDLVDAHYGLAAVLTYYNQPSRQLLDNLRYLLLDPKKSYRALIGHYQYGVHVGLPRPARYITLLRDPVRRVVSDYYERIGTFPHNYQNADGTLLTIDEMIERDPQSFSEIQTKYIAGTPINVAAGEDTLAAALAHLEADFVATGTVEQFDDSLRLIGQALGWPPMTHERKNVGGAPPPLAAHTRARIVDLNPLDQRLYDHVAGALERRLAALACA